MRKHWVCHQWPFSLQQMSTGQVFTILKCLQMLDMFHVVMCCIVDTFYKVALTSILGTAAGVHGVSGWLLSFGATVPASDCWLWGAFVFFSFLNVSVDTGGLVGTERWPGEGWREEGSWAGDDSAALVIWWHGGKWEQNPLKAEWVITFPHMP